MNVLLCINDTANSLCRFCLCYFQTFKMLSVAPFTQPVQRGNVVPLFRPAVLSNTEWRGICSAFKLVVEVEAEHCRISRITILPPFTC